MKMTDKDIVRYIIKRLRKDSERENYLLSNHIFRYIRDYIDNIRDTAFLNSVKSEMKESNIKIDPGIILQYYDVTRPEEISLAELNILYKNCKRLLIEEEYITSR